jgi:outer membrane protein assembly factor BamE
MSLRVAISVCACLLLSACFLMPYRIDVQQGNYLDREEIAKLKPGMTHAQVRFILGTPLIADPFNPNRWDYLYYNRPGSRIKDVRRLTLYFEGDRLTRALADAAVAPVPGKSAGETTAAAAAPSVIPTPPAEPAPPAAPKPSAAPLPSIGAGRSGQPLRPVPSGPSRSPVLPGHGMGTQ